MNEGLISRERASFLKKLLSKQLIVQSDAPTKVKKQHHVDKITSNADSGSKFSIEVANALAERLSTEFCEELHYRAKKAGQTVGNEFEEICSEFIRNTFIHLDSLRPGNWLVSQIRGRSSQILGKYEQYSHLSELDKLAATNTELRTFLGDGYTVAPDVVIERYPESDESLNKTSFLIDDLSVHHSPLRAKNHLDPSNPNPILHSSISCKFTMRSDRAQNTRTEALNLLRSRKGQAPHIVSVTAEPLPSRISSLALGTGDIDCVYHIALYELREVIERLGNEEALSLLDIMIQGKRLKDISDLPLDLAI